MLSKNQVVAVRKAIESTYVGNCTITEQFKEKNLDKTISFIKAVVIENQPCKLSFEKISGTNQSSNASSNIQTVKVMISPDINIKPGSMLAITQNGITTNYKNSGMPAIYGTHQEIVLDTFEGWS